MRDVIRYGLVLGLICIVAAGILAYVNEVTHSRIEAQKVIEEERALASALPDAATFKDETGAISDLLAQPQFSLIKGFYEGYSTSDQRVGAAIKFSSPGYSGDIEGIVGITNDGKISGVVILSQQETPGLGANVTTEGFRKRFLGKDVHSSIKLKKDGGDIDALTGATISSRAVARAVDAAGKLFVRLAAGR
ncbi:MAG TPA: RnfABCDGE type electron transport complex subunit G [Firmicutes bacterium]|nr:RnfABCDGE type electron transport complex subunit G [Bacillota bacterium]